LLHQVRKKTHKRLAFLFSFVPLRPQTKKQVIHGRRTVIYVFGTLNNQAGLVYCVTVIAEY